MQPSPPLMDPFCGNLENNMRSILANILALGLVAGIIGVGFYFFAFGQTFEGDIEISAEYKESPNIGVVTFQSRFKNRRFLTHSMFLDLAHDTPITYRGDSIDSHDAIERFSNIKIDARVGYREEKPGWGCVVSLDLEPPGSSPKEVLLISSLLLIFGCTASMAVIARFA
jgi:hypothetical protein